MIVIGVSSGNLGDDNQMRGIIVKARDPHEPTPISRDMLLTALDGRVLHPQNFANDEEFCVAVDASVDAYMKKNKNFPQYVILPINHSAPQEDNPLVDYLSQKIKAAFAKHNVAIKTMVLISNLYNYKNVDLINIAKQRMSDEDVKILQTDANLRKKTIITLGVPSNISMSAIKHFINARKSHKVLDNIRQDERKIALVALGGEAPNGAAKFTLNDAEELFNMAIILEQHGYRVIFTNGWRTPNKVADYLYEKCRQCKNIIFYNSKKIAQSDSEKNNPHFYDGKYCAAFAQQKEKIDNIYPIALSVCDIYIGTYDSFSYTAEGAALGLTTVVYTKNKIDDTRPDCRKLYQLCHDAGYVMSVDEMLLRLKNHKDLYTLKMPDTTLQIVKALKISATEVIK